MPREPVLRNTCRGPRTSGRERHDVEAGTAMRAAPDRLSSPQPTTWQSTHPRTSTSPLPRDKTSPQLTPLQTTHTAGTHTRQVTGDSRRTSSQPRIDVLRPPPSNTCVQASIIEGNHQKREQSTSPLHVIAAEDVVFSVDCLFAVALCRGCRSVSASAWGAFWPRAPSLTAAATADCLGLGRVPIAGWSLV
jgi:hypothetical protein